MNTKRLVTAFLACTILTVVCMVFWIPAAFDLTSHEERFHLLLSEHIVIDRFMTVIPYGPGDTPPFYIPLVVAFLFGFYDKALYKVLWLSGLIGGVCFAYITFLDMQYGVEGGWAEYGASGGIIVLVLIATIAIAFVTLIGGIARARFDEIRLTRANT